MCNQATGQTVRRTDWPMDGLTDMQTDGPIVGYKLMAADKVTMRIRNYNRLHILYTYTTHAKHKILLHYILYTHTYTSHSIDDIKKQYIIYIRWKIKREKKIDHYQSHGRVHWRKLKNDIG